MTKMINSQMNDILNKSNPVMADCPPMKEDYEMTRQSDTNITALYERLSHDDDQQGDSNSILHQKAMLEKFARENHFRNIRHFTDDGYSGTNFNRPEWQRMIAMVDAGQISTVIVKDMSRIGRNYLEVGMYTDIKFPNSNVRFIAVNNGVDSANQQENDFTPLLNIINEFYVKDTSKKIRAVMKNKGESGEYLCTNPPYGYRKDPENPKKHWLVDEEAAQVVKRIFSLCMEGYGPSQIARKLKADKVSVPTVHAAQNGANTPAKAPDDPYNWAPRTISGILDKPEYLGHMVNFKTHKQSYKSKKKIDNPKEEWMIFPNTHEAIIDEETFTKVQKIRKNKRRPTRTGKSNMFSGIAHHEDAFRRALGARKSDEAKRELASKKRTVQKSENRLAELDRLFKHIYEDMVNGRLSEARFQMLSDDYEKEQAELRNRIELLNEEIERQEDQAENVDRFIRTAKRYLYPEKLTPTILNDMVNAVYVHAPDKSSGQRVQDVEISYNYVGILPAALLHDLRNAETA